ncbi:polysaccharide biosynthesis C-terminal domain-containing protein [Hymenobacter tibetensis]|uniref:Polysaccharide biosynthesis C-terminal domain-containing protein n=1 Tax=Hymenobacter tibetensis TaxID=497967 RepID=A0ABY4D2Z0_9BACT|nr:polysaccharide biosynthesis C-terminal domain-containing protein [Hymenobacter tibetensis]UOG76577.1 polysaccharide biosynthesis C-terminal domain-containing protein [Hymenobacter tibetensis]
MHSLSLTSAPIKRFFGNISLVVLLNLLVKPGWVLVENLVQDRLGHHVFGTFASMLTLASVMAAISDLGTTQFTTKRVAAAPDFLNEHFPTLVPLKGMLSVLFLGIVVGIGWVIGYRGHSLTILALTVVGMLLAQYTLFLRGVLQANQRFNTDALLSVLEKFLLLGLVLGLIPIGITLDNYVAARSIAIGFTFVVLYALIIRLYGRVKVQLRWEQARTLLKASLPLALITLVYGLNERIDILMLERLVSSEEASYYNAAYRLGDIVMMYLWTVLPLFFAKFAYATTRPEEQRDLLWFGQRIVTVPMLLVCAFVLFRGEVLFWQFTHSTPEEISRMVLCVKILFGSVLVHAFFAIYSTLLTSTNHEKAVSWLVVASTALNVALNLLLLPRLGAVAGAINTLVCAVFVSIGYLWLVHRRTGVPVPWGWISRLAVAFGLLCAVWYGLQTGLALHWLPESVLASVAFVGILFLSGVVRIAELRKLLKVRQ